MQLRVLALGTAAALAASRIAAACDDAASDGGAGAMYSPGVVIGAATNTRQHFTDLILGGEVSVFRLKDWSDRGCGNGAPVPAPGIPLPNMGWLGGYADADFDFETHAGRMTVGPELGWDFLGLDGGLALERASGKTNVGFALRGVVTFGFVQVYERGERFADGSTQLEVGILLKRPTDLPGRVHGHVSP